MPDPERKHRKAPPLGLPLRAPKAVADFLIRSWSECQRLSGLDREAVHELLMRFRHGLVRVEGLGAPRRDLKQAVSLDLYVALHDFDLAWAMFHSLRDERNWLWGRGVAKVYASAPSVTIAQRAAAILRRDRTAYVREFIRKLGSEYFLRHLDHGVTDAAFYVERNLPKGQWNRPLEGGRVDRFEYPLKISTIMKHLKGVKHEAVRGAARGRNP